MPSIKESIALLFQAVHAWVVRDNKQQWQKISRCHVQLRLSLLLTYVTSKHAYLKSCVETLDGRTTIQIQFNGRFNDYVSVYQNFICHDGLSWN